MSRLTITLSENRYRALKEASAQRDKTIGQLIDESLEFYGIKSREDGKGGFVTPELDDMFPFLEQEEMESIRAESAEIRALRP